MTDLRRLTFEVSATVEKIRPLLAGHDPKIQGAVLTDLVAIFLAGHFARGGDPEQTRKLREALLTIHVETVWELIPANEEIILKQAMNTKGKGH
jgi:hypothetical protein